MADRPRRAAAPAPSVGRLLAHGREQGARAEGVVCFAHVADGVQRPERRRLVAGRRENDVRVLGVRLVAERKRVVLGLFLLFRRLFRQFVVVVSVVSQQPSGAELLQLTPHWPTK